MSTATGVGRGRRKITEFFNAPASLLISRLIGSALALLTSPIIAQAIGAEGRGLTAAAVTALTIVPIALALGLPWTVRRRCAVEVDPESVVRSSQILALTSLVPGAGIGVVMCGTLLSGLPDGAKYWLIAGLALAPCVVGRNCLLSYLVVRRSFAKILIITVSQPLLYFVLVLILMSTEHISITSTIAVYVISVLASYIATAIVNPISWFGSRAKFGQIALDSLRAAGAQISEIASYRLNQLILLPVIGGAALGNYSVALNVALAPAPIGQAIGSGTFKENANSNGVAFREKCADSVRAAVSVGFVSTFAICALSPFVVPWAFGEEFEPAVPAAMILSFGGLLVMCNYTLTSNLIAAGDSLKASVSHYVGFAVGVVLLFVLSYRFGLIGAACASSAGFLTTAVLGSAFLSVPLRAWIPTLAGLKKSLGLLLSRGREEQ
ncbi:lipopolysaccharide biosynthesis protein [Rhodococcus sp. NPDC127530]|uniref:lipopolysaccharide biosynthesis protein n=1 Tax=unclassified Rhodococcus (in: high G+C Gram-positive bacteria) TaxID=192944 RepID=UPI00362FF423